MSEHDDLARQVWNVMWEVASSDDRKRAVAEALDLSFARVRALRRLAVEPRTGRELAADLITDPPFVSVIVDDLEARGLVKREPHPTDRRAKLIKLTAAGRRAADKADALLGEPPEALRALPPEDLAALDRILRKLAS